MQSQGNVEQPLQWSSEYFDSELSLSYYNFRYYNSYIGRWTTKDYISEWQQHMLYSYVANYPIAQKNILGLWFPGTHSSMTLAALKDYNFYFNVKNVTYRVPIIPEILDTVKEGNVQTDSGKTKNLQWYHFCENFTGQEDLFIRGYKEQLDTEKRKFHKILSNTNNQQPDDTRNNQCADALRILGQLNHMWQDYYGHGRQSIDEIGIISGSPDNIQAFPSSFSYKGFWGNHGGVQNWLIGRAIEPGSRASDADSRKKQSVSFTQTASSPLLKAWFESCKCLYYRDALESVGYCCKKE